jgi:hypothetical protein
MDSDELYREAAEDLSNQEDVTADSSDSSSSDPSDGEPLSPGRKLTRSIVIGLVFLVAFGSHFLPRTQYNHREEEAAKRRDFQQGYAARQFDELHWATQVAFMRAIDLARKFNLEVKELRSPGNRDYEMISQAGRLGDLEKLLDLNGLIPQSELEIKLGTLVRDADALIKAKDVALGSITAYESRLKKIHRLTEEVSRGK